MMYVDVMHAWKIHHVITHPTQFLYLEFKHNSSTMLSITIHDID